METKQHKNNCKCAYCVNGHDTRPERHSGQDIATDDVLRDMAIDDAMDEIDD